MEKTKKTAENAKTQLPENTAKKTPVVNEEATKEEIEERRNQLTQMLVREVQSLRNSMKKLKANNEMLSQLVSVNLSENGTKEITPNQAYLKKLMYENEAYKKLAVQRIKDMVLNKVKEEYPDVTYNSFEEFPEEFHRLVCAKVSPAVAYRVTLDTKNKKSEPATIGKINANSEQERDFYTSKEVDKLTKKQLSNPKIMNTVLKSMLKW